MQLFTIWTEGYAATGESGTATYMGEAKGKNLQDAVKNLFNTRDGGEWVNKDYTAYWGCKFFDNEADARKSFG